MDLSFHVLSQLCTWTFKSTQFWSGEDCSLHDGSETKSSAAETLYAFSLCCRHLAEAIRQEYGSEQAMPELIDLAKVIIPYDMEHNAEIDACDLAMEIERLDLLEEYVDKNTYQRVCLYLTR